MKKKMKDMKVGQVLKLSLVDDSTRIYIRDFDSFELYVSGNWYHDYILDYSDCKVDSFIWENNNELYINVLI